MRRKDRELTQREDMLPILAAEKVCRLGLSDEGQPYVLPMNFGFFWPEAGPLTFYFHCAHEGRKLEILAKNGRACVELDCQHQLVSGEKGCDYSFRYASLLAFGSVSILTETADKNFALQKIMEQQAGPGEYAFSEADMSPIKVFSVQADEVTGKQNAPK